MAQPDEQRFERFYYAHYDRVAAYLLSRAGRDHAQDALARTFEVAWRRSTARTPSVRPASAIAHPGLRYRPACAGGSSVTRRGPA
jgi:DNA-directed RNA polymerase specialized sigma24 family protein